MCENGKATYRSVVCILLIRQTYLNTEQYWLLRFLGDVPKGFERLRLGPENKIKNGQASKSNDLRLQNNNTCNGSNISYQQGIPCLNEGAAIKVVDIGFELVSTCSDC